LAAFTLPARAVERPPTGSGYSRLSALGAAPSRGSA
jgi:hypothetical protein